jgi:hypothetical protein
MVVGVSSRYVVERGSGFGVGFRKVVLPYGEVVYKCVKCLSIFCSLPDVELHITACGKKREREVLKYGYVGWCKKPDKRRVLVRNTVSNVLLCCGCPYFHSIGVKHLAVAMVSGSYL